MKPDLDPRLDPVILTAIRKCPDHRYPTMEAFEEDLERILGRREGAIVAAPVVQPPDLYAAVTPSARLAAEVLHDLLPP